jgi:hypothetical protein
MPILYMLSCVLLAKGFVGEMVRKTKKKTMYRIKAARCPLNPVSYHSAIQGNERK